MYSIPSTHILMGNFTNQIVKSSSNLITRLLIDYETPTKFTIASRKLEHALDKNLPFGQENLFCPKKNRKWPILVDTNLGFLTLKGSGRQTLDTRSTSVVPLKSYGHDGSNGLCGRSVASKLSVHRFDTFGYFW